MADNKSSVKRILKDTLALVIITVVAAAVLGLVREITAGPIAEREAITKQNAYRQVLPEAEKFAEASEEKALAEALADSKNILGTELSKEVTVEDACLAKDASGNSVGFVLTVVDKKGYGGDIRMAVGYSLKENKVSGIQFLTIGETAGFGLNAEKKPEWRKQYYVSGVTEFRVTKSGSTGAGEIDALSGATITSKAVTNGVNGAVRFAAELVKRGIGGAQ